MSDTIDRQAAIDEFLTELTKRERTSLLHTWSTVEVKYFIAKILEQLPSAQTEPAIPLSWIEGQIEWLKSLDNDFSILTAGQISAMVNKWKDERNEQSD